MMLSNAGPSLSSDSLPSVLGTVFRMLALRVITPVPHGSTPGCSQGWCLWHALLSFRALTLYRDFIGFFSPFQREVHIIAKVLQHH